MSKHLTILGGGPAGLAAAYYAKKAGLEATVYEATSQVGGICRTVQHGEFRYDIGAHRFHDKDPEITAEIQAIMGDEMAFINIPSQILSRGNYLDFPLSAFNVLVTLGPLVFLRAAFEVVSSRLRGLPSNANFEEFAVNRYGQTLAGRFLLNYSQKLWGVPCTHLSPKIAGKRLQGLDVWTFLREIFIFRESTTKHMEGSFFYPKLGFGRIVETLERLIGPERIRRESRVTTIRHDNTRITSISINGQEEVTPQEVVSTLPMSIFLRSLDPPPPAEVLEAASRLRFRNVVLVGVFLDKPSVTSVATVYFPDSSFAFTRIYEPRNRSPLMAPPGKTSLFAEIPCQPEDEVWTKDAATLQAEFVEALVSFGWITPEQVLDGTVYRIPFAYPVIEQGVEQRVQTVLDYCSRFENLHFSGRNGRFVYSWLHEMMRFGKEIVAEVASR